MDRYAVVIPAYNESATIRDVATRALCHAAIVIVVDDGSGDGTSDALAGLNLVLIRNEVNLGKAASLWRGIQRGLAMGADAVITLDGDAQHEPEEIPRFLAAAQAFPGMIVIGSRLHEKNRFPPWRYRANRVANFLISWAAGYAIEDTQSGFRLYPAGMLRAVRATHNMSHSFVFESEVLIEAGRKGVRSIVLPIRAIYGSDGRASHFRPVLDIARIGRMLAWKLITWGLYLPGLVRSLRYPPLRVADSDKSGIAQRAAGEGGTLAA